MVRKKIYLCGNISADPQTYLWRDEATKILEPNYTILNPAANKFNREMLKMGKTDGTWHMEEAVKKSQNILIVKDYQLVASSDIILANLSIITTEKPPLGTVFELAWSWQLKKPVIAIVADNLYCQHPFPRAVFSATAESLKDACELIRYLFTE